MQRRITSRHPLSSRGLIRRVLDPSTLGEHLKPFVFLDFVHGAVPPGTGFGFHPHSGIATLTYHLDADVAYEDTAGQNGLVRATGLEWMLAGGGTWHQGHIHPHANPSTGFQLWVVLPPGVEDGPSQGLYVQPEAVPQVGPARVLLGELDGARSPIPTPSPMLYADVALGPSERFVHRPPPGHDVAWVFVYRGQLRCDGVVIEDELVVFDRSGELELEAVGEARFLVGTAVPHPHPLVLGTSSIHTNLGSLEAGHRRIREIGAELVRTGRM